MGKQGWAGRAGWLAWDWQLGNISTVIKSRNGSPSSRTLQAMSASLAGKAALPDRLAVRSWHRGSPHQAPSPGCQGGSPEPVLGSLQAPWDVSQWVSPQTGTEGPLNLVQASPQCSAASIARLPPGIVLFTRNTHLLPVLPGNTHPHACWYPLPGVGEPGTPGPEEEA